MTRFDGFGQMLRADACQKDHDVQIVGHKSLGEFQGDRIVFEREFPHGRRTHGDPAGTLDERRGLVGHAAFERHDSQSRQRLLRRTFDGARIGCRSVGSFGIG